MFKNMSKSKIMLLILVAICVIIGVRIFANIQKDKDRAAKMSQSKSIAVTTIHPRRMTIQPVLDFSGNLDPEWKAELASKVDGRIQRMYVKEGDFVKAGQVLAELEQSDTSANLLSARGSYMDAQTNLQKAEADLARYEKLYASGAVSEQIVDNYRFARNNAAAKLENAKGTLNAMASKLEGTVLRAPEDGQVVKRFYQEGYYAKAGTPVLSLANISRLKTVVHVPEGQISSVAVGNEVAIKLPAYPNKKLVGKVSRIAPVADLPSHTFQTEVSVPNQEGVLAGVYANVELTAQPKADVLTIPLSAVIMRDDQKTVFVVDKEGVVQRRVVNIGYTDDKVAEILGGLTENDLIVSEGHNKLREGSKIKLEKAGDKQ